MKINAIDGFLFSSIVVLIVVCASLPLYKNEKVITKPVLENKRDWQETKEGVKFFTTCIDKTLYNATPIADGYSLALTHKACDVTRNTKSYGKIKW